MRKTIDLPNPQVFFDVNYEAELEALKDDFIARAPEYEGLLFESDPIVKMLEVAAYKVVELKNNANEKYKQMMLKFATGNNLENIAANTGVTRLVIHEGDPNANPPIPPTLESDDDLRERAFNAPERFTVAGPSGAYEQLAKDADGRVKDAVCLPHTPEAGSVTIVITSRTGSVDESLKTSVDDYLSADERRPVNDKVIVSAARAKAVTIALGITYYTNSDFAKVNREIRTAFNALFESRKIGEPMTLNEIHHVARVNGVQNVKITTPSTDISAERDQYLTLKELKITELGQHE